MTTPRKTVEEKVGEWHRAYSVIKEELTPPVMREMQQGLHNIPGATELQSAMLLSRLISANDRTAGIIAAMLVATGIKPVGVDLGDEPEDV